MIKRYSFYSLKRKVKYKKIIIFYITTYQTPHFEFNFDFFNKNKENYSEIIFVDLTENCTYRHDYLWRNYSDFLTNVSRKIRNGIIKKIYLRHFLKKNNFIHNSIKLKSKNNLKICQTDLKKILTTYSSTEFKSLKIIHNKYTPLITSDIKFLFSANTEFIKLMKFRKSDHFVIFNGRLPHEQTIRLSLNKMGYKKLFFHECNQFKNNVFYLTHSPHDLSKFSKLIHDYNVINKINKNHIKKWLIEKKLDIKSFKKKYITYFTSSNDEYQFVYDDPINQKLIINKLLNLQKKGYPIKIKVHPNTINKSIFEKQYWFNIKKKNPDVIINFNEDVSTYDLIQKSLFTLSIGSSVAAESIVFGVPHILIGTQNWYHKLNICHNTECVNYICTIKEKFKNIDSFDLITNKKKELAVSSLLFIKDIGYKIWTHPIGSYPTKGTFRN
jgi:hypothetical protein